MQNSEHIGNGLDNYDLDCLEFVMFYFPLIRTNVWFEFSRIELNSMLRSTSNVLSDFCCELDIQRRQWGLDLPEVMCNFVN